MLLCQFNIGSTSVLLECPIYRTAVPLVDTAQCSGRMPRLELSLDHPTKAVQNIVCH